MCESHVQDANFIICTKNKFRLDCTSSINWVYSFVSVYLLYKKDLYNISEIWQMSLIRAPISLVCNQRSILLKISVSTQTYLITSRWFDVYNLHSLTPPDSSRVHTLHSHFIPRFISLVQFQEKHIMRPNWELLIYVRATSEYNIINFYTCVHVCRHDESEADVRCVSPHSRTAGAVGRLSIPLCPVSSGDLCGCIWPLVCPVSVGQAPPLWSETSLWTECPVPTPWLAQARTAVCLSVCLVQEDEHWSPSVSVSVDVCPSLVSHFSLYAAVCFWLILVFFLQSNCVFSCRLLSALY